MVKLEVGKKYTLSQWGNIQNPPLWIKVDYIGKVLFIGTDERGYEDSHLIENNWIEVKD